ncbi:hypothetical protein CBM2626_A260057 [Cupriavidus taiwanensis]|nr:hypothetical protein CBM2626_A260057 [Cupriavidus taiwanensis]
MINPGCAVQASGVPPPAGKGVGVQPPSIYPIFCVILPTRQLFHATPTEFRTIADFNVAKPALEIV